LQALHFSMTEAILFELWTYKLYHQFSNFKQDGAKKDTIQ